jgi:hypothetical protein
VALLTKRRLPLYNKIEIVTYQTEVTIDRKLKDDLYNWN